MLSISLYRIFCLMHTFQTNDRGLLYFAFAHLQKAFIGRCQRVEAVIACVNCFIPIDRNIYCGCNSVKFYLAVPNFQCSYFCSVYSYLPSSVFVQWLFLLFIFMYHLLTWPYFFLLLYFTDFTSLNTAAGS